MLRRLRRDRSRRLRPAVAETLSADRTLGLAELCRRWVFTVSAARAVTLPVLDLESWVELTNDTASTNDVTVKDAAAATVDTLSPGESGSYAVGASGAVGPL